jgi:glycosyltransferase involved in cell wall biosynthesis
LKNLVKEKKKVFLIAQSARGGLRKHLCDLLDNLDYQKFEVWVIYNDVYVDEIFKKHVDFLEEKIHTFVIHELVREMNPLKDIVAYKKLNRLMKEIRPDIVHCHSSKAGVAGRLAATRNHVKKIFYSPHWYAFLSPEFSKRKRKLFILIERVLSKYFTTKTFACSMGEKETAISNGIDKEEKFLIIHNGIPDIPLPSREESRRKLKLPLNAYILGNVARMVPQKNPLLFFHLSKLILEKNPWIHFVWIGDGPLLEMVKNYIDQNGLSNNIHIYGYLSEVEILVSAFDGTLTTTEGEGFSYSILESLRVGIPVLSSNVMGNNEAIITQKNGMLFDSETIVENPNLVFDFIDWSKTITRESVKQTFLDRFPVEVMIKKISEEYLRD